MKLLEFIFSGFWIFVGFALIFGEILTFILNLINRILRHRNIRKYGYPPAHCDADGDFRKPEKK
jgi:hypothetical protein